MPPDNPVVDILHPKSSSPAAEIASLDHSPTALRRTFTLPSSTFNVSTVTVTRIRTDIIGYTLGSQTDKPLQSLDNAASKADATLTPVYNDTPTYSEWDIEPATVSAGS